jgi:translation initiation factor 1
MINDELLSVFAQTSFALKRSNNSSFIIHHSKNMGKKNRKGVVYSTSNDFEYHYGEDEQVETLPPQQQNLRVMIDRKQRKGKEVTLVTGFVGTDDDLKELGKILKTKCGVGGSAKDSEIIIQGNQKEKALKLLLEMGYKAKPSGG